MFGPKPGLAFDHSFDFFCFHSDFVLRTLDLGRRERMSHTISAGNVCIVQFYPGLGLHRNICMYCAVFMQGQGGLVSNDMGTSCVSLTH